MGYSDWGGDINMEWPEGVGSRGFMAFDISLGEIRRLSWRDIIRVGIL